VLSFHKQTKQNKTKQTKIQKTPQKTMNTMRNEQHTLIWVYWVSVQNKSEVREEKERECSQPQLWERNSLSNCSVMNLRRGSSQVSHSHHLPHSESNQKLACITTNKWTICITPWEGSGSKRVHTLSIEKRRASSLVTSGSRDAIFHSWRP
jgi:hypothetical protein